MLFRSLSPEFVAQAQKSQEDWLWKKDMSVEVAQVAVVWMMGPGPVEQEVEVRAGREVR